MPSENLPAFVFFTLAGPVRSITSSTRDFEMLFVYASEHRYAYADLLFGAYFASSTYLAPDIFVTPCISITRAQYHANAVGCGHLSTFARHPWLRMPVAYAIRVRVRTDGVPLRSAGHCNVGRLCDVSRYTVSDYAMWACCAIHACMVTAAAAPALMERTEPNWLMYTTSSANSSAFFDRPGPSAPNSSRQRSGKR